MAKTTATITADGSAFICNVDKPRNFRNWFSTFLIYGTFGSGTVTLLVSPDGGTTKIPLKNEAGTAITTTSAAMFTIQLGDGSHNNDHLSVYATVTGSTNPSIVVSSFSNV